MKITISWNELPKYAAYPLAEIIKKNPDLEIVSIRSKLPIDNLEKILNKKIHWVENKNLKWKDLGLEIPEIYFQAGWYKKSFSSHNHLSQEFRPSLPLFDSIKNAFLPHKFRRGGAHTISAKYRI